MCDRSKPHALGALRCQRRTLTGRAEEHEPLVRGEHALVILAFGIDPEFEHSARAVEGARHSPLALELTDIAQVHKHDIVASVQRYCIIGREALDLPFGSLDQSMN